MELLAKEIFKKLGAPSVETSQKTANLTRWLEQAAEGETSRLPLIWALIDELSRCNNGSCQRYATHKYHSEPFLILACDKCAPDSKNSFPVHEMQYAEALRRILNAMRES